VNMIRAIALSLALLLGIGTMIPFATDTSEAHGKHLGKKHKKTKKFKKYKKYSKKWWRQYRQRMKKRKALAARKRAIRVRQILLARAKKAKQRLAVAKLESGMPDEKEVPTDKEVPTVKSVVKEAAVVVEKTKVVDTAKVAVVKMPKTKNLVVTTKTKTGAPKQRVAAGEDSVQAMLPTGEIAPQGWKRGKADNEYRVDSDDGRNVGTASISDVGPITGTDSGRKTLGGVPTSALRRTVIDKMVREEGWVVNDFQKEINGKKVYVVVAQSPGANGTIQSRIFYFTESNGRIYSLATNASVESAEKLAKDSERILNSLHRKTQSADLR
jgi:hypothetical protein